MSFLSKLFGNKKESKNKDYSESLQYTELCCPNCNQLIDELPKRKKRCFNCKKAFYPLKKNKTVSLISEDEHQKIKDEQEKIRFREKWLKELSEYGITKKIYYDYKKKYFHKIKFNENENDVIWSIFNKLIHDNPSNFEGQKNVYYSMFHFLREEGKDGFKSLQLSKDSELKHILLQQETNLTLKAVIITAKDACDNCKKYDGKTFTIQEALEIKPIPHIDCLNSFCRCCYGFEAMRDENGNLIL